MLGMVADSAMVHIEEEEVEASSWVEAVVDSALVGVVDMDLDGGAGAGGDRCCSKLLHEKAIGAEYYDTPPLNCNDLIYSTIIPKNNVSFESHTDIIALSRID